MWSPLATKIAVSKYFYGDIANGTDPYEGGRENSVKQLVHRVTRTITDWGIKDGYFADAEAPKLLPGADLAVRQPVWRLQLAGLVQCRFVAPIPHRRRAGLGNYFYDRKAGEARRAATQYEYPQGSACFIQSSLTPWRTSCAWRCPKRCSSSTGPAPAAISRSCGSTREKFSGGGKPSGPLSFLKVYDQVANVVKSAEKRGAPRK